MKNSILGQLSFEPGHLTFKGIRYMLIRPDTIVGFQKAVEAAVGQEKCAEIMMAGGITGGTKSSQQYKKAFDCSEEEIVSLMCKMGGELGWGDFHLQQLDKEAGHLVVEVTDSPFAAAYGQSEVSVCHMIRGVMIALGTLIFKGKVSSFETTCIAKGNERCRFEITKI